MPQYGNNRRENGRRYEEVAAKYYQGLGFQELERNWQAGHREIDLIIQNDSRLVFVEVKGGGVEFAGNPVYRVDKRKRRLLQEAAECYLASHNPGERDMCFDVLVVLRTRAAEKIERFENAISTD